MDVELGDRKICASDVPCDSLYELIKAMNNFLCGSDREVVEWSLEPDYERWIFDRTEGQPMIHIVDSEDVRWVSVTNAEGIIEMIAGSLEKCYEKAFRSSATIGKNWSWDFPLESLRCLQKKLAEQGAGGNVGQAR